MDQGIAQCKTKEEAQEFMRLYRAENPYADENIGYVLGYYSPAERARLQDWFGVTHPVFGKSIFAPEEAYEAGRRFYEKLN